MCCVTAPSPQRGPWYRKLYSYSSPNLPTVHFVPKPVKMYSGSFFCLRTCTGQRTHTVLFIPTVFKLSAEHCMDRDRIMAEVCSTKSVLCRLSPCVNRAGHCLENSQRASGCVEDSLMRWCKTKRTSSEVKKVISTKMTMKMSNWRVHEIQEVKNCPMN